MPKPIIPADRDKFHIDPSLIPEGTSYQWIAVEVFGVRQDIEDYVIAGWQPVPYSRHVSLFPLCEFRGKILLGGMVLAERPIFDTKYALSRIKKTSHEAAALFATPEFSWVAGFVSGYGQILPKTNDLPSAPYDFSPAAEDVEVKINLRLTVSQVEMAAVCHITTQEYGQRVASMMCDGRLDGFLLPSLDGKAFEVMDRVKVGREHAAPEHCS